MLNYQIISYDVWGNNRDGYEVNDCRYTPYKIELPDDFTDKQLKRALYDSGYASRGIMNAKISIEGEAPYSIYVNLTAIRHGGYYPYCELRPVEIEKPTAPIEPTLVHSETAYGSTQTISHAVKCF